VNFQLGEKCPHQKADLPSKDAVERGKEVSEGILRSYCIRNKKKSGSPDQDLIKNLQAIRSNKVKAK
jgi:hypothetical protein